MRRMGWCGVFLSCVAMHGAWAQQTTGNQQMSVGQNQSIMASMLAPANDEPYQAEKVSRSVQTLGDGTVITNETRGTIARDAQGRMREEMYQVHSGNVDGKQMEKTFQTATVGDPVTHAILIWTGTDSKIAMRMQLPSMPKGIGGLLVAPPPPPPPGQGSMPRAVNLAHPALASADKLGPKYDVRTEELGHQSIEGVLVTGKRTTTTIPTGAIGNDRPIVVVHEEWRSPELKILVKTIDTDPRTGEQTMELQGLTRTDPDAALFQAPAGYKVQDLSDMMKNLGSLGGTPQH